MKKKKNIFKEWLNALVFAAVAATIIRTLLIEPFVIPTSSMEGSLLVGDYLFVSKVNYGPRTPITPLSFPFVHHTLPGTKNTKSYSDAIQLPYFRLPGISDIKRNDVVVFNYPMEDFRPVDKKEHYIKRCVAVPGDSILMSATNLYVNGIKEREREGFQKKYLVSLSPNSLFNKKKIIQLGVREYRWRGNIIELYTSQEKIKQIEALSGIDTVISAMFDTTDYQPDIFPQHEAHPWNTDFFGTIYVPRAGDKVELDSGNIHIYKRAIEVYENNELLIQDKNTFIINGEKQTSYTFKMDYYFMLGDNRHYSEDSRYWGFVPENHIVGKALFVWLSIENKNKNLLPDIRWSRIFKPIE